MLIDDVRGVSCSSAASELRGALATLRHIMHEGKPLGHDRISSNPTPEFEPVADGTPRGTAEKWKVVVSATHFCTAFLVSVRDQPAGTASIECLSQAVCAWAPFLTGHTNKMNTRSSILALFGDAVPHVRPPTIQHVSPALSHAGTTGRSVLISTPSLASTATPPVLSFRPAHTQVRVS